MWMDVSKALSFPGQTYPFQADIEIPPMIVLDDPVSFTDVHGSGEYVGSGSAVTVRMQITGKVTSQCALCLEPVTEEISCEADALFKPGAVEGEDDYPLEGCKIDLLPYVREALLLELPMRFVCSDDCKGLCPVCGANRNTTRCSCQEGENRLNPFSALSELRIQDEEV